MGSSWAALAVEEGHQRKGVGTLLAEAGAGREGGWRGGDGRAGVWNSKNNERIRWQPSLIGRISRAGPTEGSEECAWELCPVSNLSSRAWKETRTGSPKPGKYGMIRFTGAREKSAMTFVKCLGTVWVYIFNCAQQYAHAPCYPAGSVAKEGRTLISPWIDLNNSRNRRHPLLELA